MQVPNSRTFRVAAVAVAVLALGSCKNSGNGSSGGATCGSGECKLTASDSQFEAAFGLSVTIEGDNVVVGSSTNDVNGVGSGAAYAYRLDGSTWEEFQKIVPDDGAPGDRFGAAVSMDGDILVISAVNDDDAADNAGSVYVYRLVDDEWELEQKLVASDGVAGDSFGNSVSVSSDAALGAVIAIGAFNDDGGGGASSGTVYTFRFNGGTLMWDEEDTIEPVDSGLGDFFGVSVAIDDDTIAIGSPFDDDIQRDSGAVYMFSFNGASWILDQKIKALRQPLGCETPGLKTSDAVRRNDFFGISVALDNGIVVIGADGSEIRVQNAACGFITIAGGNRAGKVYVFEESAPGSGLWNFDEDVIALDFNNQHIFGRSVAIDGDTIVVGARGVNDAGALSGGAYVFINDAGDWVQDEKLNASDAQPFDLFGESVDVSGDNAVIGAYGDDDNGPLSGAAYTYEL